MAKCKICQVDFATDKEFNSHLRSHSLRQAEYYQEYEPRRDLFDDSIIKFKNKEQYLSADFNSKANLKKWLESLSKQEAYKYCKDVLEKRKEKKGLIYAPTQVELRSIMIPPVSYLNGVFGGYYEECERMGFKNKYVYPSGKMVYGSTYGEDYKIYVDTREQRPLSFKRQSEIKTLKFADYAFSCDKSTCNCYIERKSISDLIGTLSGGFERFCREIERAWAAEANFIVLVEDSLDNCLKFNELSSVYKKQTRVTPDYIFRNVRDIIQKYPFVQFLFVHGRDVAAETVEKLFTCGCGYKKIDLQLAYDLKLL